MVFTGKNYNFALIVVTTISTMAISAAAKADPNPYLQADVQNAAPVSQSTVNQTPSASKPVNSKIKKKINIITPSGKPNTNTDAYVKDPGEIFVKSGRPSQGGLINSSEPFVKQGDIFVKSGSPSQGGLNTTPINRSLPSAVKTGESLKN
jgi:hypothetical protein